MRKIHKERLTNFYKWVSRCGHAWLACGRPVSGCIYAEYGKTQCVVRGCCCSLGRCYAPDKVGEVDKLLAKAAGKEEKLFAMLIQKVPPPTSDTLVLAPPDGQLRLNHSTGLSQRGSQRTTVTTTREKTTMGQRTTSTRRRPRPMHRGDRRRRRRRQRRAQGA